MSTLANLSETTYHSTRDVYTGNSNNDRDYPNSSRDVRSPDKYRRSPERRRSSRDYDRSPDNRRRERSPSEDAENKCTVMSFDKDYHPKQMKDFHHEKFPHAFERIFQEQGFKKPTPIQSYGLPIGMDHKDIIGVAKTGSGKTLAFILPGICEILEEKRYLNKNGHFNNSKTPLGLVIAPTRELAVQIHQHAMPFCKAVGLEVTCIYGGAETWPQRDSLQRGVDLLIATPGRLLDFVERNNVYLNKCIYFVIDEADRMLDMGFIPQVKKVVEELKPRRQTLLFSATWPKEVEALSDEICRNNPVKIKVGNSDQYTVNKDIKQIIEMIGEYEKKDRLLAILRQVTQDRASKIMIFTKTKKGCDRLQRTLEYANYSCQGIHGDKPQNFRQKIINDYKRNAFMILVATDVASRGIDVKDVKHVINYDFPQTIEDYIHRIGRTGRAGQRGESITFFTQEDGMQAKDLVDVLTKCDKKVPAGLHDLADKMRYKRSKKFGYHNCAKSFWKSAKSGFGENKVREIDGDGGRRDRSRSRDRGDRGSRGGRGGSRGGGRGGRGGDRGGGRGGSRGGGSSMPSYGNRSFGGSNGDFSRNSYSGRGGQSYSYAGLTNGGNSYGSSNDYLSSQQSGHQSFAGALHQGGGSQSYGGVGGGSYGGSGSTGYGAMSYAQPSYNSYSQNGGDNKN